MKIERDGYFVTDGADEHRDLRKKVAKDGVAVVITSDTPPMIYTVGMTLQNLPELVTFGEEGIATKSLGLVVGGVARLVLDRKYEAHDGARIGLPGDSGHVHLEKVENPQVLSMAKMFAPLGMTAFYIRPCYPGSME